MEKLTISRVGQEKEVQTQYGLKKKVGVQFKEYGDIWHDVWKTGLKVGEVLEGTRDSRDYNGKTYWNFKLPKKEERQAMDFSKVDQVLNKLTSMNLLMLVIAEKVGVNPHLPATDQLKDNGLTSDGTKVPDFSEVDNQSGAENLDDF